MLTNYFTGGVYNSRHEILKEIIGSRKAILDSFSLESLLCLQPQ